MNNNANSACLRFAETIARSRFSVNIARFGNPVRLVTAVPVLSLCFAPLYYGLNYCCVTRFIKEDKFRVRRAARVVAVLGIVVMLLATLLYAAAKLKLIK